MAVLQSFGELLVLESESYPVLRRTIQMYDQYSYDYATLYRTQPNVRTCVDFIARNIAQLGLHVYRRISDVDRRRLIDHALAKTLNRPNLFTTRYRMISETMSDLGVYFNAYWLKLRAGAQLQLVRIPPPDVQVKGGLFPSLYEITIGDRLLQYPPGDIVHFRGYNAESTIIGLSPLETLRRVLAEEFAAGEYRESFWRNSARIGGIIERPATAPEWSETARERFKAEFEALYSGASNSGRTAILEEGMTWKAASFTAQESEYLQGRKLTREECARAYHIPLPMVGILDHATFSNIREQHKNLYQDCLGPWMAMIEQEIELQLLPEFEDVDGIYVEFNIAEKLQGSFEEQTASLQSAVGRPWMTANEARARLNMPQLAGDADQLVTPLNVMVGGQASPRDSAPPPKMHDALESKANADEELDITLPELREQYQKRWTEMLRRHFARQERAIASKYPKAAKQGGWPLDTLWDAARWNRELESDMYGLSVETATVWGEYVANWARADWNAAAMYEWLANNSRIAAEEINASTRDALVAAIVGEAVREGIEHVFDLAKRVRAEEIGRSRVTLLSNFGANEAARQTGVRKKTWRVNSKNPRDEHAALDGVSVPIGELFPNGMRWPGDPHGGPENIANCQCTVVFGR